MQKKTLQNPKKLPNPIKLDPLSCPLIPVIFIKRYTRSIIFVTFRWQLSNSWIYSWKNFLEIHWRCLQNIVLQNPKKTPRFSKICPKEFSFHTIHLYKKNTLGVLILRQFIENWAFPEFIPKLIKHLNIILKTHFQGSSKRFAINYFL